MDRNLCHGKKDDPIRYNVGSCREKLAKPPILCGEGSATSTIQCAGVLGHEDVAVEVEKVGLAGVFEDLLDGVFGFGGGEVEAAVVAAEGDEVEVAGLLKAFQAVGHGEFRWVGDGSGWRVWGRAVALFARWPSHDGETVMNKAPDLRGGGSELVPPCQHPGHRA